MAKRTIEIFTAGCELCTDVVEQVRDLACPSCDIQQHDLTSKAGLSRARALGVTRAPTVVVDGRVADCCRQGAVDPGVLRGLGVGVALQS